MHPLENILRQCAEHSPQPWYPSAYAQAAGVSRDSLDPELDQLRMSGLIQLTEWVQGKGQGYVLTPAGKEILESPRQLARLLNGQMPDVRPMPVREPRPQRQHFGRWERGEAAREALLNTHDVPYFTFGLIAINVLVFAAGMALAASQHVPMGDYLNGNTTAAVHEINLRTGFLFGPEVYVRGEWWRLLTACFNHIGWMHLAVNMYSLFVIGPLLERIWGSGRFLVLYLISGLAGSCGMLIENPLGGGAGASGAIWGILASFAAWIFLNQSVLPPALRQAWWRNLLFVFLANGFITFYVPGISKGGHFGGGIGGLLAALPLDYLRFGKPGQRVAALVALLAIPTVGILIARQQLNQRGGVIDFADELEPEYAQLDEDVVTFFNQEVVPILKNPAKAPPETVRKVQEGLEQRLAKLEAMQGKLNEIRTLPNPRAEKTREQMLKDIAERIQKFRNVIREFRNTPSR